MKKILYYGKHDVDFLSYHKEPERKSAFRIYPLSNVIVSLEKLSPLSLPVADAIVIDSDTTADLEEIKSLINLLSDLDLPIYIWMNEALYDTFAPKGFDRFIVSTEKLPLIYDCINQYASNTVFFHP